MRQYEAKILISDRYNDENPLTLERIKQLIEFEECSKNGLEITQVLELEVTHVKDDKRKRS